MECGLNTAMEKCGLLLPDEGQILLDGYSLYEYSRLWHAQAQYYEK